MGRHLLGGRAEDDALQRVHAMATDDDQRGADLGRDVDDGGGGAAASEEDATVAAQARELGARAAAGVLPRPSG